MCRSSQFASVAFEKATTQYRVVRKGLLAQLFYGEVGFILVTCSKNLWRHTCCSKKCDLPVNISTDCLSDSLKKNKISFLAENAKSANTAYSYITLERSVSRSILRLHVQSKLCYRPDGSFFFCNSSQNAMLVGCKLLSLQKETLLRP